MPPTERQGGIFVLEGFESLRNKKYSTHMKWMLYFMARPEGWPRGGFALRCLSSQHSCFGLRG